MDDNGWIQQVNIVPLFTALETQAPQSLGPPAPSQFEKAAVALTTSQAVG